jgi:hypothetical protein
VLSIRAERAHVTWGIVNQAVPDHLILPLEALATLGAGATFHTAIVRTVRGMHVGMGVEEILRAHIRGLHLAQGRERERLTWVWKGCAVQPG